MTSYVKAGRISAAAVQIPNTVKVNLASDLSRLEVTASGNTIELLLRPSVKIEIVEDSLLVHALEDFPESKALAGTYRSIINNAVIGLTDGWQKKLLFEGVGYKVMQGKTPNSVALHVGYSNPIEYDIPNTIKFEIQDNNRTLVLTSHNKQNVGQTAADIRSKRVPNAYSGKGIRYSNEIIKKKEVGK